MSRQDYVLPDGTLLGDKSTAELVDMAQADPNDALEFFALSTSGASHESFVAGYDPVTDEPIGQVAATVSGVQSPIRTTEQTLNTVRQGEEYNQRAEAARLETRAFQAAIRQARLGEMHRYYLDMVVGLTEHSVWHDLRPDEIIASARETTLKKFNSYQQAYRFDDTVIDEAFGIISPAEAERRRVARRTRPILPRPHGF
jgi:hypothetical protein